MPELRQLALAALAEASPARKCAAVEAIPADIPLDTASAHTPVLPLPGREARPPLVMPRDVPQRSLGTPEGRAALIHALAHIELNAVNLALDILWRFPGMPEDFYRDWLRVAKEEAFHFGLLRDHLASLGHAYGDFPAHNGLWEMAQKTRDSLLARLALVPRMLEARGLDVSPAIKAKLLGAGDTAAAAILDVILRDEIGHVAIGNRWYKLLCAEEGLDPVACFDRLASDYGASLPRGPFNLDARRAAGFSEAELLALQAGGRHAG
ncbi:ferritin-like domain-containing protein [Uliginosibacterium paludis]|uniref:Ferritin-like domain-containing protein n=1 Tax=Uliginosibacterium paludis TaxID=1615952 RepID=A0ABV2CQG4_9RHOO